MVYFPNSERKKREEEPTSIKQETKEDIEKSKKNEKLKTSGKNELKYINYHNNVNGLNSPIKDQL